LTVHGIQTADTRLRASVQSQCRHFDEYNFGGSVVDIDVALVKRNINNLEIGQGNAKDCRIYLPGRSPQRRF
jgi:hypothetical protein